jgi:hypothetical protein
MARNGAKWQLLLESRARGRTVKIAAQESGYSLRQASRIVGTTEFQEALQQRLDAMAEEDRAAFGDHRRAALNLANLAMTKLADVLRGSGPDVVLERAARTAMAHARQLFPSPEVADLEDQLRGIEADVRDALALQEGGGRPDLYAVPAAPDRPAAR